MIVFTIAYGERHIRQFFDRCLPSLMTEGNLPSIADLDPELLFLTHDRDAEFVRSCFASTKLTPIFGDRVTIASSPGVTEQLTTGQKGSGSKFGELMLGIAIDYCIRKEMSFLFAVPDLIYSNGVVRNCSRLHRLTGKVVAIFNGRVTPSPGSAPFATEALLQVQNTPNGIVRFFFDNMSEEWRNVTTNSVAGIPGDTMGHLIYHTDDEAVVFCSAPNPFIGKFLVDDFISFAESGSFKAWDHRWCQDLFNSRRLFVQTNLDQGMSIEPDDNIQQAKNRQRGAQDKLSMLQSTYKIIDLPSIRRHKFNTPFSSFCFTTAHRLTASSMPQRH